MANSSNIHRIRPKRDNGSDDPHVRLDEALIMLRRTLDGDHCCDDLTVGDKWELGEGLGLSLVLISKPLSSLSSAANESSRRCVRLAAVATSSATSLPGSLLQTETLSASSPPTKVQGRCVALCDFLCREFEAAVASSATARSHGFRFRHDVGPFCLETNRARVFPATGTVCVFFDLVATAAGFRPSGNGNGSLVEDRAMVESITSVSKRALLGLNRPGGGLDVEMARAHIECIEDQRHLREVVASSDGIAFVADGSVLPRSGGANDAPMEVARGAVPFVSPASLRREFELPNRGKVSGMLVPRGVTLIIGGGYHGKSTLLRALAVGVYDKVPGDGREFVVTDPGAVTVRAEDGRPVSDVDISPFISSLPSAAAAPATTHFADASPTSLAKTSSVNGYDRIAIGKVHQYMEGASGADVEKLEAAPPRDRDGFAREGVDVVHKGGQWREKTGAEIGVARGGGVSTERFSTGAASGSTSQASNVVEALEAGATALLLDEDTCAGNFMIRDSRMRAIVHHEPITPFIYRVKSLWLQLGVSSVIVVGGCGDYFDVHDTALLVDNYLVSDATERAHSVSRRFCVGRVQFAGRGLVHRLPWPEETSSRAVVPESVLPTRVAPTKRKMCNGDDHNTMGGRKLNSGCALDDRNPRFKEVCRGPGGGMNGAESDGGEREGVGNASKKRVPELGHGRRRMNRWEGVTLGNCECRCLCGLRDSSSSSGVKTAVVRGVLVDLSRVEQLVGRAAQIRGCAHGVEWLARATKESPRLSVSQALDVWDSAMREGEGSGLEALICPRVTPEQVTESTVVQIDGSASDGVIATAACCSPLVARPRRFEVAAALHRLPGVRFQLVREVDGVAHSSR